MKIYAFADEASPLIDEQINAIKENRIDGIEIRNVDNVNISEISDSKAKEVKKKLDDANLKVWSIGSPIGKIDIVNDDFLLHSEKFKRTLELAYILESENIRLFSFFMSKEDTARYKDEVIERLSVFCDIANGSGVTLCHENEKGIFGYSPENCLQIHQVLPKIKAVFDPANYIQCNVDTLHAWNMIKPYVKYLHIKDADKNGNVVPAGYGIGNLKDILSDFISNAGNCVTVEPHLSVFSGLDTLEKDDDKSAVGKVFEYKSNKEAFDAAICAFRKLYKEEK